MATPNDPPAQRPPAELDGLGNLPLLLMIQVLTSDCQCEPCRIIRNLAHRLGRITSSLMAPGGQVGDTPPSTPPAEPPALKETPSIPPAGGA